jgi:hypothetical protein
MRTLVGMTALQQELEALKIDRNQERVTAKNLQTFLANQVRDLHSTVAQSAGSAQPPVPSGTQTARPESWSLPASQEIEHGECGWTLRSSAPSDIGGLRPESDKTARKKCGESRRIR